MVKTPPWQHGGVFLLSAPTDYKKANDGLYALLAEYLKVFNERFAKGSDEGKTALRRTSMLRLQADGIRVVKTSTTMTMLARANNLIDNAAGVYFPQFKHHGNPSFGVMCGRRNWLRL